MASSVDDLANQLKTAGTRLLPPPSSVDKLLPILDEVENCLELVEQSPSKTMQDALSPLKSALVAQELLGHSDPDVKVSVATCINEITRITAPDAPYNDDQMKDIFQLIVSSFEKLHDMNSRSFKKRTTTLETVARVRSCVMMLDLECDSLILEMFQHFLKSVRDYHPDIVFKSMETIMTLVLDESEDISPELLSPILEYLKKDNKSIDPVARRLGENVLKKCSSKVKPYLVQAIKTLGSSLDDYNNVVASVCQELPDAVELNGVNVASNNSAGQVDLPNPSSDGAVKEVKEDLKETASQDEVSPAPKKIESTINNGNSEKVVEEAEVVKEHLMEQKCDEHSENKEAEEFGTSEVETELIIKPQPELIIKPQPKGKNNKKRGRKRNLSKSAPEPSEATPVQDNNAEEVTNLQESESKHDGSLHCEDTPTDSISPIYSEKEANIPHRNSEEEAVIPNPNNEKEADISHRNDEKEVDIPHHSSEEEAVIPHPSDDKEEDTPHPLSKASENEAVHVVSPSLSGETTEGSHLKELDRENKTEAVVQEVRTVPADDPKKDSEADASGSKADKIEAQTTSSATDKEERTLGPADASRKDDRITINSDTKTTKLSSKKFESVSDQQIEKKIKGQRKTSPMKDSVKPPPKKESKESDSSPKRATKSAKKVPSSASSKRKHPAGKDKASQIDKHGEELVGARIKVWWPKDKEFYEGVVESFSADNKKHKVLYIDGDVEVLNMEKEKWEHIKDVKDADKGDVSDEENQDASSEIHKKKKIKTNPAPSNKQGNSVSAKKRVGGTSSFRSKVAASKPGSKQSNEETSNDEDAKEGGGFVDEKDGKSSDDESMEETPKAGRSKEDSFPTPKTGAISKQTAKGNTRSKGKTSKGSGSKSKVISSSKGKETTKKSQNEIAKSSQSGKGKSSSTSMKAQKSETKSGNKRKRGSNKK